MKYLAVILVFICSASITAQTCYGINANVSTVCSSRGTCVNQDTCQCVTTSYAGARCQVNGCVGVNDCYGPLHGVCNGPNTCTAFQVGKVTRTQGTRVLLRHALISVPYPIVYVLETELVHRPTIVFVMGDSMVTIVKI
jgi:hypothetical protein